MTQANLLPGQPGFDLLPVPVQHSNPGGTMNREALRRLVVARAAGWRYDPLADLYNTMKLQIEATQKGWRAVRMKCVDGSHAFIGSRGPVLVIMPSRRMYIGRFASDGLLRSMPLHKLPDGSFALPAPNIQAPGTTEVQ